MKLQKKGNIDLHTQQTWAKRGKNTQIHYHSDFDEKYPICRIQITFNLAVSLSVQDAFILQSSSSYLLITKTAAHGEINSAVETHYTDRTQITSE